MSAEWVSWARSAGFRVDGAEVVVAFHNSGRSHRVRISDEESGLSLRAIAVRAGSLSKIEDLIAPLWQRNRSLNLIGIVVEDEDRVVVMARMPRAGWSSEEFSWLVRRVAAEADRLEFLLTGRDVN